MEVPAYFTELTPSLTAYYAQTGNWPHNGRIREDLRRVFGETDVLPSKISPSGHLEYHDEWGNFIELRTFAGEVCLYSSGPNGRDERGFGDDLVIVFR